MTTELIWKAKRDDLTIRGQNGKLSPKDTASGK